jgi:hypothetical protein
MSTDLEQRSVCERQEAPFDPPSTFSKVGIALSTLHLVPLNGLRHRPDGGTSGWFIWGGRELSTEADFFQPLHVHHLKEACPAAVPFLALPPGYRFLLAEGNEDVWHDPSLLEA